MAEGNGEVRELPEGWCWVHLQEISQTITDGDHQPPPQSNEGIPFTVISNIQSHKVDFSVTKFVPGTYYEKIQKSRKPRKGDILYTVTGSFGIPCLIDFEKEFCFQRHIALVRLNEEISKKYIFYLLQSSIVYQQAQKVATGTAQKTVSLAGLRSFSIPLSPFLEQNRIVEKIEELFSDVDQGVESLKTAQKQLKVYRQAVLKWAFEGKLTEEWRKQRSPLKTGEALLAEIKAERENRYQQQLAEWEKAVGVWEAIGKVGKKPTKPRKPGDIPTFTKDELAKLPQIPEGWVWARIDEIGDVQLGRQRAPKHHTGEYMRAYLRVANVFENRIDISDVLEMNFTPEEYKIYELKNGDILLNEGQSLELVGRSAIYRDEIPGACFQNTLVRFKPSPLLSSTFPQGIFLHYFHSGRFQKIAKWTTSMAHLGAERFAELEFPLPSLEEQEKILEKLERIQSLITNLNEVIEASLKRAEALRQSILKQAFEGKLVPQDPNDEPAEKLLERIKQEKATQNPAKAKKGDAAQLTLDAIAQHSGGSNDSHYS